VVLKPHKQPRVERVLTLAMPPDLPKDNLRIGVAGGDDSRGQRSQLGIVQPRFDDLPSALREFQDWEANNILCARVGMPDTALSLRGRILGRLPSPIERVLSAARTTATVTGKDELVTTLETPWVLVGKQILTIATEDKHGEKGTVSKSSPAPPTTTPAKVETEADGGNDFPEDLAWAWSAFRAPTAEDASDLAPTVQLNAAQNEQGDSLAKKRTEAAGPPPADAKKAAPDAEKKEPPKKEEDTLPVARQAKLWLQSSAEDFREGEAHGVAITSDGHLMLSPQITPLGGEEQVFQLWSAAVTPQGQVYFGTGQPRGLIVTPADGKLKTVVDTGAIGVHALLARPDGSLLAGTAPDGRVLRVDPASGKTEVVFETKQDYVWSLAADDKGNVYVGTGSAGRIFVLPAQGPPRELVQLPQEHVLCLAWQPSGLLAGTSEDGLIYRVDAAGRAAVIHDSSDKAVCGLAVKPDGTIYAGTAPAGNIEKIAPDGKGRTVCTPGGKGVYSLAFVDGVLYAGLGGNGEIVALLDDDTTAEVYDDEVNSDVLCLAPAGADLCYAGTGNGATALRLNTTAATKGTFDSAVLDAKRPATWREIAFTAEPAEGGAVQIMTRSGESADPDQGWGVWSASYTGAVHERITSPPGRFLQFQAVLSKAEGKPGPRLKGVAITYLPQTTQPKVTVSKPTERSALSGDAEITWKGDDDDKGTIATSLYAAPIGTTDWALLKRDVFETKYTWDTKKQKDGRYRLMVVASNRPSNPADAKEKAAFAEDLTVDNTAPNLIFDTEPKLADDKTVPVSGAAADDLTNVVSVEYRIGEKGRWVAAAPGDGTFDSPAEKFSFRTTELEPGEQILYVRAYDGAGNKTTKELKFTVPGEKKAAAAAGAEPPAAKADNKQPAAGKHEDKKPDEPSQQPEESGDKKRAPKKRAPVEPISD
jgi:sugar lactone lactonase YvrE